MAFAFPKIYAQLSQDTCGTWKFDCYKESGFRLTSDPVICMDLPSDRNIVAKMRAYTEDAVSDWQDQLNAKSSSSSLWNIQLIPTAKSDACNISIQFIAKPTLDQQGGLPDAVGITRFYADHTAQIEIFYNAIDDGGNFLDSQAPDYQIRWTIKHELGHAFGLDHYMMTDQEQKDWVTGLTPTPSIMVQIVPSAFSVTGTWITYPPIVTYKDIAQLKSLYNNNGFGGQARTTFPSIQSPTMQQISISTDKQIYYYGDHVIITIDVPKVTGANATLTLVTRGSQSEPVPISVIISELHGTITSLALDETNSPTGTVDVTLSYDGQTASTSFQIDGQSSSSVTSQDTTQPETPHSNQLEKFMVTQQLKNGPLSHHAFRTLFFSLNTDGFIHIDDGYKFQGYVVKPDWLDKDVQYWADGLISDEEFASSLQYLFDNDILRL